MARFGDLISVTAQAAVLQERMGVRASDIQTWTAVAIYPDGAEFLCDDPIPQNHGACAHSTSAVRLFQRGQPVAPMGRAHALDPAPFLIDEDGGIAAHGIPQRSSQGADLIGIVDVAGEEDEAPGVDLAEKGDLTGG